jgi:anti-sigma regulatory factor (Ser/Thr protein kinase)
MNAIEHAGAAGPFVVDASIAGDSVDVTVRDNGRWRPVRNVAGGRGLDMMHELMDVVEVTPEDSGTTVRMRRSVEREIAT